MTPPDVTDPQYAEDLSEKRGYKFRAPNAEQDSARAARAAEASVGAGKRREAKKTSRARSAGYHPDTELLEAANEGDKGAIRRCEALYVSAYGKAWAPPDEDDECEP